MSPLFVAFSLKTTAALAIFAALGVALAIWFSTRRRRDVGLVKPLETSEAKAPHLQELWFGQSEDAPAIQFSPLSARGLKKMNLSKLYPSTVQLSKYGPGLQAIVSLLPTARFASGNYMRVVVNGPLAAAGDGTFLPFVRGTDGRVSSLARLVDGHRLQQVLGALAVWQLASVLVAQKHLADISKELKEINRRIGDIKEFLENERASKIIGRLHYLGQVYQAIMKGELTEAARPELESAERELIAIQEHLARDLRAAVDGIERIEHSDLAGTSKFVENIDRHQGEMFELLRQWVLCVRTRVANWLVLLAFPKEGRLKSERRKQLLKFFSEFEALRHEINTKMERKIDDVKSSFKSCFNRQETLDQRQGALRSRCKESWDQAASSAEEIRSYIARADRLASDQERMILAVKVDKGQVVEAYALE